MTIKGIIFDFDGLILDTEIPEYQAWQEIYAQHNRRLKLEEYARCLGSSNAAFDPLSHLQTLVETPLDLAAVLSEQRQRSNAATLRQPILPGIVDYLQSAGQLGIKKAVASSSSLDWVGGHINRLGLSAYFDCIRTSEDVEHVKPAPDLYLHALGCLNINADEAIVFEDSPNGITAARRAGIFCVAVPNALSSQLDTSHADLQVASLSDLPLTELIQTVLARRSLAQ